MNSKGLYIKLIFLLVCLIFELQLAEAQIFKRKKKDIDDDPIVKELPTYATSIYARIKLPPDAPLPVLIYTNHPKQYLVGNRCVDEFSAQQGYLYVSTEELMREDDIDPISLWFINWNEKTKVFFTRGPFWKRKLKKRIEQCKLSSGYYK